MKCILIQQIRQSIVGRFRLVDVDLLGQRSHLQQPRYLQSNRRMILVSAVTIEPDRWGSCRVEQW